MSQDVTSEEFAVDVRPGYKYSELGEIPGDWEVVSVGQYTSITTGSKNTQDRIDNGPYPFFVRSNTIERIDSFAFDCEGVLTAGDGVGTGKVFHYVEGKFNVHQRVYLIHDFRESLVGKFFYRVFSERFYQRIAAMTAKSSVDSVRQEMIADMLIPLPSLPEQTAIAEALTDVDNLIAELEKLIQKKKDIKQATMQQLLTGRTRLPEFATHVDGTPKGTKHTELGEIPEDWEVVRLGDVYTFLKTSNNSRADLGPNGDLGYIHYGDVHTKWKEHLNLQECVLPRIDREKVSSTLIKERDLVVADASEDLEGVGKLVEVLNVQGRKLVAGLHTYLLRDTGDRIARGFGGYIQFFPSVVSALHTLATGLKVYGISKTNYGSIELPLPSLSEQSTIVEVLSDIEEEIKKLEQRVSKTKQIKQGMMQELLTGKTRLV